MNMTQASTVSTISPEELKKKIDAQEVQVIDIRAAPDVAGGHVPGARNITGTYFKVRIGELAEGKDVVLVCEEGDKSAKLAATLNDSRLPQVYVLEGGFQAWRNAGFAVETTGGILG